METNKSGNGSSSSNVTASASVNLSHKVPVWDVILGGIMCILLLYLSICQFIVLIRQCRSKQISFQLKAFSGVTTSSGVLFTTLVFALSSGCVYYVLWITHWNFPSKALGVAVYFSTALTVTAFYMVLWLRQASVYNNPRLTHLTTPVLRFWSRVQGLLIILGVVAVCVGISVFPGSRIIYFSWQFEIQISLLALFVWPLVKHQRNLKNSPVDTVQANLIQLVWRAVTVTAVSILIDVAAVLVYYLSSYSHVYAHILVLNYVCILFCFTDWRERFLPFYFDSSAATGQYGLKNGRRNADHVSERRGRPNPIETVEASRA